MPLSVIKKPLLLQKKQLLKQRNKMKAFCGCFLFLYALWGCAARPMTMQVDPHATQFTVSLPANPTTGYQWASTAYDKSCVTLSKQTFLPPKTHLIGAGGVMTFVFVVSKNRSCLQKTTLSFTYSRPWEKTKGTVQQVLVHFTGMR